MSYAVQVGSTVDIQQLLEFMALGAHVDQQADNGLTALALATIYGNALGVKLLLEHGASPDVELGFGKTAMAYLIDYYFDPPENFPRLAPEMVREIARLLLLHGANSNVRCEEGKTPLMHAILMEDLVLVRLLLNANADADIKDPEGWTALMGCTATSNGIAYETAVEFVQLLVAHRANVNLANDENRTALSIAAEDNPDIAHLLLREEYCGLHSQEALSACDTSARGPIHYAIIANEQSLARTLANAKADINMTASTYVLDNFNGWGKLKVKGMDALKHSALEHNDDEQEIAKVSRLLDMGMDPNAKTPQNFTAIMFAAARNRKQLCQLLVDRNAEVDVRGHEMGLTALMFAASTGAEVS